MDRALDLSPRELADALVARAAGRVSFFSEEGRLVASRPGFDELAEFLTEGVGGAREHEAVFLAVGPESGALLGAFIHSSVRGQAQGGLRRTPYVDVASFLRDGMRLSWGMSRKNALAGLWWGGGKGLIAGPKDPSPEQRRQLYLEFGDFVTSLQGCYVTAEDAGTHPEDVATVFERTRFVTCVPEDRGGAGNPSPATAAGVVCGMEAALQTGGGAGLVGRRIAMQGLGNVGSTMVDLLLARGVDSIVASDISAERCGELAERWRDAPVEVRLTEPGDPHIFLEPCDVLVPNAMGGVIGPDTIPKLQTALVCGAANNPLLREDRDGAALKERGIQYAPDFVVNRMGIVYVANEQYGRVDDDALIGRHLDPDWEHGIPAVIERIFREARQEDITPIQAANRLAAERCQEPHPIFGHRTREILRELQAKARGAI